MKDSKPRVDGAGIDSRERFSHEALDLILSKGLITGPIATSATATARVSNPPPSESEATLLTTEVRRSDFFLSHEPNIQNRWRRRRNR
ncbi:hypothetical protein EVAR_60408_1 [Eumeta japonica]|uniref:Uncharacterized protein n=1 Tax=Eumeta variegata TaxID=151549 RepID=A0A4C1YN76_EUMVA|nr:hypothetical protein EVAR_60408_1 [Eumeta japonica]